MNTCRKILTALFVLVLAIGYGVACASEELADMPIELKGYENDGEYQYIELGYYPYTSTGSEQPILWRVLSVHGDMALMRSEYVLDVFQGNKYSDVDCVSDKFYWNALGTFIERGSITSSSIPSVFDLNSTYYGFSKEGVNASRKVEATPYAAANGVLMENGYAAYWTYDGNKISYVTPNGGIIPVKRTMSLGIVPMITASISELRLNEGTGTKKDPFRSTYSQRNIWFENNMRIFFFDEERYLNNPDHKKIQIYTGPGEEYYQVEGSFIKNHGTRVNVLAREGSWLMIEYMLVGTNKVKSNCYKTGWIYEKNALNKEYERVYYPEGRYWYTVTIDPKYGNTALPHKAIDAVISKDAMFYDDRNLKSQPMYILEEGRAVRLLGYLEHNDILLGYVEADIYDQKARGFVRLECLEAEDYDIGFMTVK